MLHHSWRSNRGPGLGVSLLTSATPEYYLPNDEVSAHGTHALVVAPVIAPVERLLNNSLAARAK